MRSRRVVSVKFTLVWPQAAATLVVLVALALSACSGGAERADGVLTVTPSEFGDVADESRDEMPTTASPRESSTPTSTSTSTSTSTPTPEAALPTYFATIPAGDALPGETACADAVRATPLDETHPQNAESNATSGGPTVNIDGAIGGDWNAALAPRINGNFTGTTEELIRWAACKWGFDEDLTRARAWTESSWNVATLGDETTDQAACQLIGLASPCFQSYGLLQVKGTVHEGTFPHAHQSSAWGLDYAMAWQRACLEGSFEWLIDDGYVADDVRGCVGAWFSGEWYDDLAEGYLEDVDGNLKNRPWE